MEPCPENFDPIPAPFNKCFVLRVHGKIQFEKYKKIILCLRSRSRSSEIKSDLMRTLRETCCVRGNEQSFSVPKEVVDRRDGRSGPFENPGESHRLFSFGFENLDRVLDQSLGGWVVRDFSWPLGRTGNEEPGEFWCGALPRRRPLERFMIKREGLEGCEDCTFIPGGRSWREGGIDLHEEASGVHSSEPCDVTLDIEVLADQTSALKPRDN